MSTALFTQASMSAVVTKAALEPQLPWSFTGVTRPYNKRNILGIYEYLTNVKKVHSLRTQAIPSLI
jgi:hypothetical protein